MEFFEIPAGEPETNFNQIESVPVDVFVYRDKADCWCRSVRYPSAEGYLVQIIKAVPVSQTDNLHSMEDDIEIGDVFCLDEPGFPTMMRVETNKPDIVIVIKGGLVSCAFSLTGKEIFYTVIDEDLRHSAGRKNIPEANVTDGCVESTAEVLELLKS